MEETYRLLELKKGTKKDGGDYYVAIIYISSDYISDTYRVFISVEAYNYLRHLQDSGLDVDISRCFTLKYRQKDKKFDLVFDESIL